MFMNKRVFINFMKSTKKVINKMCSKFDEKRFYKTYGKVLNIDVVKLLLISGLLIPCGIEYALIFIVKKYNLNKNIFRICYKN